MGAPREPQDVKLFVALLYGNETLGRSVEDDLARLFGPVDRSSRAFPWTLTNYYEAEMGPNLVRRFLSFAPLVSPERLAEIKLQTRQVEEKYRRRGSGNGGRGVNVDPGYLDAGKVVLASTKRAGHRIYLKSGIYGEITLFFHSGSFQPLVYTYRDYLWPESLSFFFDLRRTYLNQSKMDSSNAKAD